MKWKHKTSTETNSVISTLLTQLQIKFPSFHANDEQHS